MKLTILLYLLSLGLQSALYLGINLSGTEADHPLPSISGAPEGCLFGDKVVSDMKQIILLYLVYWGSRGLYLGIKLSGT